MPRKPATKKRKDQGALIVASLGRSAFESEEQLDVVCEAAPDVVRINFSHTKVEEAIATAAYMRKKYPKIRIMQDLQGVKIRVGTLPRERRVAPGDQVAFVAQSVYDKMPEAERGGQHAIIPVQAPFPFSMLAGVREIRMKDGSMAFGVVRDLARDSQQAMLCATLRGGVIRAEKGMNVPGVRRDGLGLPDKDRSDLEAGREFQPDIVCVSFVTGAQELEEARELIGEGSWKPEVWAKVECQLAMDHLAEIVPLCDAVMIGRGDLGGELGLQRLESATEAILQSTVAAKRRCLVGTGLLESMRRSARPEGEEVDAILRFLALGAGGFLLTAETTVGSYRAEAIASLRKIIEYAAAKG